jgi:hypothetical protein
MELRKNSAATTPSQPSPADRQKSWVSIAIEDAPHEEIVGSSIRVFSNIFVLPKWLDQIA